MGNLDSLSNWRDAQNYVEMQWWMQQQGTLVYLLIATGCQVSVLRFVELTAA